MTTIPQKQNQEMRSWGAKIWSLFTAYPLLFITGIGFFLRIYRLPQQSLWLDDWLPYVALRASDLQHFLQLFKITIPEHTSTPVFYVLLYFWSQIVGINLFFLRLLSLAVGSFSIVLIFLLGTRLFSRRVGLLSALFLALSPAQIWFSQELRPYGLMFFLALASLLTLEYALGSSQKHRFIGLLYYCVTTLFLFNHLFSFLILPSQGIYILSRKGLHRFVLWTLLWSFILCILCISVLDISHTSVDQYTIVPAPGFWPTLSQAISKDIVGRHSDLLPVWGNISSTPLPPFLRSLLLLRPSFDTAFLFLVLFGLAVFLFYSCKRALSLIKFRSTAVATPADDTTHTLSSDGESLLVSRLLLILLLICFSSFALSFLQGLTGRPVSGTSYDGYNMIGVYLALAFVISKIQNQRFFQAITFLILFFYAYQCLIFLPYRTRPDWQSASGFIREHAGSEDLIIDDWSLLPFASRVSPFLDDLTIRKITATSIRDICEEATFFLKKQEPSSASSPKVWIITEPIFSATAMRSYKDPLEVLTSELQKRHLCVHPVSFSGFSRLTVLQVTALSDTVLCTDFPELQCTSTTDYQNFLSDLGLAPQDEDKEKQLIAAFQRATGVWRPVYTHTNIGVGFSFLRNKEYHLAGAFADYLLRTHPYYGLGYYYMGTLLALAGETERAKPYFVHAFRLFPVIKPYSEAFSKQLCVSAASLPDRDAIKRLASFPYPFFADLDRYLEETSIPMAGDSIRNMIPEGDRAQLAAALADDEAQIDAIFSAQQALNTTEAWLPVTKRLPAILSELGHFLWQDADRIASKYKELIATYPFELFFYERYDFFIEQTLQDAEYVANWLELAHLNPEISSYVAHKLEEKGTAWLDRGHFEGTLAAYEASLTLMPDSVEMAAKLGELYLQYSRFDEALESYATLLKRTPYLPKILNQVDRLLENIDDDSYTVDFWKNIHQDNNQDWEIARRYGTALERSEYFSTAAGVYLALKEDPDHGCNALMAGIRCLRVSGDIERALALLSVQNPEDCDPPKLVSYEYIATGQLLLNDHQISESSDCFNKALAIGGFDALAYFGLGQAALTLDDVKAAIAYFKESVNADPDNHWHRQCLAVEQFKAGFSEEALENFRLLLLNSPDKDSVKQVIISLIEKVPSKSSENMLKEFFETISPIVE